MRWAVRNPPLPLIILILIEAFLIPGVVCLHASAHYISTFLWFSWHMALALIPKSKRAKAALATATGHWDAGRKAQGGWEGGWRLEDGGRQVGINHE